MTLTALLTYLGLSPSLAWFVLGFVLLILEVLNPSALIFFFGFGAWTVSAALPWFELSVSAQIVLFLISSLIYLALLRTKLLSYIEARMNEEPYPIEDDFIGKQALVTTKITPPMSGKVMINGTQWSAVADRALAEGQPVVVTARDNLTLKVEALS